MRNILLLGLVSFFSDVSTEMVYPLIPLYLSSVFGATPALVGLIEGIAESTAGLLKVFSGYFTDKYDKKKPVAFLGYATGLVYKLALLFASSWFGVLCAKVFDRIGKGVRTAPRDVLVSESAEAGGLGKAFGIHKALDMAGSALGIFIAYLLLANMREGATDYKKFFLLSSIPALLGLIALLFVKETRRGATVLKKEKREGLLSGFRALDPDLKLYLLVAFIFTLGNSSNSFLLLRAKSLGYSDMNVVLLYLLYNLTAALLSVPLGRLSDKLGRKRLLVAGYIVFSIVYLGFGFAKSGSSLPYIFALYGFYTAATAGTERALIAEVAPPELKGTMLGLHASIVSLALLPASIIAGLLWDAAGAFAPFALGSALSLAAAVLLIFLLNKKPKPNT